MNNANGFALVPKGHPSLNPVLGGLIGLALCLTACAVGPASHPDTLPKPPQTTQYGPGHLPAQTAGSEGATGGIQTFRVGEPVPGKWWVNFGSQELDKRVEQAFRQNPTLASAQAALVRAQEYLGAAQGGGLPAVGLRGGASRQNTTSSGLAAPYDLFNASVTVSYTLDLFGAVRRGVEVQQSVAEQQRWLLEGTYLALAANVATASIREASLRAELDVAETVLDLLKRQEDLIQRQVTLGVKSPDDLLAAQANVASAQARLPGLRKQLDVVRTQLNAYLGRYPSEEATGSLTLDDFTLPSELPVTLPSDLARQRPDVLAAEARVHEAMAQLGVANANLFPRLTLSGAYGTQSFRGGVMPDSTLTVWDAGLNLLQPIFNGGSLRAQKRAAAAGLDQAVADYRATVLNAFGNVADTLSALQHDAETLKAYGDCERAAKASLDLAEARYRLGATSYLQILDATRLWRQAQIGLVQARAARLSDTTALYAALGGGWTSQSN